MRNEIALRTSRPIEMREITAEIEAFVRGQGLRDGVCFVYCPHTTAGLVINENADPDVCADLVRAFEAVVPKVRFDHAEGNSHAHFLSCLTGSSVQILVEDSRLQLGRWQGIFFCEFDGPRQRQVWAACIPAS